MIIIAATILITGVSVWLMRFYMRLTQDSAAHTLPYKLRQAVRYLPFLVFVTLCLLWMLTIFRGYLPELAEVAIGWSFLATLALQFLAIGLALFSEHCRAVATSSFEGKTARVLFIAAIFAMKMAWKAIRFFAKLSARSRSTSNGHGANRSPYGYHGYESYEERAQRKFGSGNF